ncbi:MAG TPA: tRNA (adenosine(37)-N6)-threonylcarbamoyltransferase complex ATPase subunit type 1 TsaE [Candidatus Baltobacteraceae bacterium]|nr:tRNA (adenosine(37)-N6)-threonylcarbamoyltransferase complex ATPase subunit type 1 TsaE [Candidatus Baltobacteraceae bacterium]
MERFETKDPKETAKIAAALAKRMKGGEVVALIGNLGAGKTVFAQAFAKALGVKERVQSPTFIFMHEHRLKRKSGPTYFVHADAYRGGIPELRNIGIEEYFGRPETVVLIEWADRVKGLLPKKRITVRLRHLGGDRRSISLQG